MDRKITTKLFSKRDAFPFLYQSQASGQLQNSLQLQNSTVNGAMSITINRVIMYFIV